MNQQKNKPMEPSHRIAEEILFGAGFSYEDMEIYYPRIADPVIPLAIAGVSTELFLEWKENGITRESTVVEEGMKLNLIDFVWVRIVKTLRQFGVSYENLQSAKQQINDPAFFWDILKNSNEVIQHMREQNKFSPQEINEFESVFRYVDSESTNLSTYGENMCTILMVGLHSILLRNRDWTLFCFLDDTENHLRFSCLDISTLPYLQNSLPFNGLRPLLQIPLRPFIMNFFDDPALAKYTRAMSMLNEDEIKIIETVRTGNFHEVIIRQEYNKKITLECVLDENILNEKAIEVRKILGMNEYQEVTIKYRNDKNLFVRNKKRIN